MFKLMLLKESSETNNNRSKLTLKAEIDQTPNATDEEAQQKQKSMKQ